MNWGTDRNRMLALAGGVVVMLLAVAQVRPQLGPGMGYGRLYDPATEITAHGVVEAVQHVSYRCRWGGTHMTLKTKHGTYDVRLRPTPFLSQNDFSLAKGDSLSVTGSKLHVQGGRCPGGVRGQQEREDPDPAQRSGCSGVGWPGNGRQELGPRLWSWLRQWLWMPLALRMNGLPAAGLCGQ